MDTCISSGIEAMKVARWGNSLAVRLPVAVVDALQLKEGEEIVIQVTGARTLEVSRKPDARALLKLLRKYRGALPADFKFDREEISERPWVKKFPG
jgi:antitoxin MazE